jgi:hypothetical protein
VCNPGVSSSYEQNDEKSEARNCSGIDYTLDRIAFVEPELAELKDRMRKFEASRHESQMYPR